MNEKKQLDQQTLLIIRLILVSLCVAIVPTLLVMSIGANNILATLSHRVYFYNDHYIHRLTKLS